MRVLALYDKQQMELYQAAGDIPATELAVSAIEMHASALFGSDYQGDITYEGALKALKESKDFAVTQSILSDLDIDSHIIEI